MTTVGQALTMAGASDPGMVRSHNEDAITTAPEVGLVVLADGMGGYNAGEVASGIAVTLIAQGVKEALDATPAHQQDAMSGKAAAHRILRSEIEKANLAIYQTAQSQPQCAGMGTTLVVALFYDNRLTIAHVGDSRMYRLRGEQLQQLTRDHSLLQEQIDCGLITPEEAKYSQNKNLVTRAVGIDPQLEPELNDHAVQVGDIYLLCSDGLNDMVEDEDIALVLSTLRANPALAAQQLVQMANDNGGRDNVSVILIQVKQDYSAQPGWASWFLSWFTR